MEFQPRTTRERYRLTEFPGHPQEGLGDSCSASRRTTPFAKAPVRTQSLRLMCVMAGNTSALKKRSQVFGCQVLDIVGPLEEWPNLDGQGGHVE